MWCATITVTNLLLHVYKCHCRDMGLAVSKTKLRKMHSSFGCYRFRQIAQKVEI